MSQSRRRSRATLTVVRMVVNVPKYVRRGLCVPVRGDDRLLPLSELPYVTAEACANADHVSSAKGYRGAIVSSRM